MLKDKVFTLKEFQEKVVCQMNLGEFSLNNDKSTIGEFIEISRKATHIDPWNGLWMAMQFFSPRANRQIAFECLGQAFAKLDYNGEIYGKAWDALRRYLAGELNEEELIKEGEALRVNFHMTKDKYSKDEQLMIKSALAGLAAEPEKACPLILLNLRPMVGAAFIDRLVLTTLRDHP